MEVDRSPDITYNCDMIDIDKNWLKLREEQKIRDDLALKPTPMKIDRVNRYWKPHGDDDIEVVFQEGISFYSNRTNTGHIPDARRVYEDCIADRQLAHEDYPIRLWVCRSELVTDAVVNVLELYQKGMVGCWVWLAEHWQTGHEAITVWDLSRIHIGKNVTQYRP